MKLLTSWTGVLIIVLLAVAMAGVAAIQYARHQTPTAIASVIGLGLVALLLSRRIARKK